MHSETPSAYGCQATGGEKANDLISKRIEVELDYVDMVEKFAVERDAEMESSSAVESVDIAGKG